MNHIVQRAIQILDGLKVFTGIHRPHRDPGQFQA